MGGRGGGRSPLPLTSHIFHSVPGASAIRTLTWSKLKCFDRGMVSPPPISCMAKGSQIRVLIKEKVERLGHRVNRVPGFLSSRPNWVPPPLTRKEVLLLPLWVRRRDRHLGTLCILRLYVEGMGHEMNFF